METGQSATMDAPLVLELVTQAAARTNPDATNLLDLGCGAGNYALKMLHYVPDMAVTLVDLSRPMLERARQRVADAGGQHVRMMQGDIRELELGAPQFDIILAAMVLHHLRGEDEWRAGLRKTFSRPEARRLLVDCRPHHARPPRRAGLDAGPLGRVPDRIEGRGVP